MAITACGDDGTKKITPDAAPTADAAPDSPPVRTCTALLPATFEIGSGAMTGMFASWGTTLTNTDLGTGVGDSLLRLEFYGGLATTLTGAIDLTAGEQSNYSTCAACVRVLTLTADNMDIAKQYFQDGGTLNLTEDPTTNLHMLGSLSNVSLIEVTVDPMTFVSTPVVGGTCTTLAALTLDADQVPAAYTCAHSTYADGTTCNCACGAHDPDCDTAANAVAGCTGTQICGNTDTCTDVCSVFTPTACPAGATCGYDSATRDICYTDATLTDAAAVGAACGVGATALFCAVTGTISGGLCDNGLPGGADDNKCRKVCDANADCAGGQTCVPLFGAASTKGVCEVSTSANDTCATAPVLVLGTPVTATNVGATNNYNAGLEAATCTGFSQKGKDVTYQITLTAGQTITAALSAVSPNFDPSIALLGPGTAAAVCTVDPTPVPSCVAGADVGVSGDPETLTFTAVTAGTYFIIVDAFGMTDTGTFTLTVN
ncbi:MAG: PPC domain-containing protein [Proteobacteria bacterium]|nr:PPC domain-containing protein [Pseudomonadota bacterium]